MKSCFIVQATSSSEQCNLEFQKYRQQVIFAGLVVRKYHNPGDRACTTTPPIFEEQKERTTVWIMALSALTMPF